MNTAVRVSTNQWLAMEWLGAIRVHRRHLSVALLMLLVIASAFSVIYVKDLNRRLLIDFQSQTTQVQAQKTKRGQLLLEESTWARQSRVQQIAESQLDMVMPTSKDVVLLQTKDLPKTSQVDLFSSIDTCDYNLSYPVACLHDHTLVES